MTELVPFQGRSLSRWQRFKALVRAHPWLAGIATFVLFVVVPVWLATLFPALDRLLSAIVFGTAAFWYFAIGTTLVKAIAETGHNIID